MGLDTTHDAWHGAYSSFYRWRCEVWAAAGLPLTPDHERGNRGRPSCWDRDPPGTDFEGYWSIEPEEPLEYVVNHSDCDGFIEPEHCALVADRLEEILPNIPVDDDFRTHDRTVQFITGLRKAAAAGDRLEFR